MSAGFFISSGLSCTRCETTSEHSLEPGCCGEIGFHPQGGWPAQTFSGPRVKGKFLLACRAPSRDSKNLYVFPPESSIRPRVLQLCACKLFSGVCLSSGNPPSLLKDPALSLGCMSAHFFCVNVGLVRLLVFTDIDLVSYAMKIHVRGKIRNPLGQLHLQTPFGTCCRALPQTRSSNIRARSRTGRFEPVGDELGEKGGHVEEGTLPAAIGSRQESGNLGVPD